MILKFKANNICICCGVLLSMFLISMNMNLSSGSKSADSGKIDAKAATQALAKQKSESSRIDKEYSDHGWAKVKSIKNMTSYPIDFYSLPRGLMSSLPDGTIIRIKALKTGFGNYYRAVKDKNGNWVLRADTRDPKDPASQFIISRSGDSITLESEVADGLLLASDSKTMDIIFVGEKQGDSRALWSLVEDQNAGDTLDSCFLKNSATGGLLTSTFDSSGGNADAEIVLLQNKIKALEQETPYITITYAMANHPLKGHKDIKDKLTARINDGILIVKDCVATVGSTAGVIKWTGEVRFILNGNKEKEYKVKLSEKADLILSRNEGAFKDEMSKAFYEHPAAELRKKLEKLQKRQKSFSGLKQSDIGRTGVDGNVFEENQWSKVAIEKVVDIGDVNDQDLPKVVVNSIMEKEVDLWVHRNPEFVGSGEQEITNFGSGQIISIDSLYSRGTAWFGQTFQNAGMGTFMFRALAEQGDVQVCFSDETSTQAIYRIVFGAAGNTKTIIYKRNVVVQETDSNQNENARITPGMIEQLWVSLNNGLIIAGKGDPGTNIIMAWQDPKPAANIKRIGLSTYKTNVQYTDVQKVEDPLVVVPPQKFYVSDANSIQVGADAPVWHSLPLSPADAGTVVFEASGSAPANLVLANDVGDGYRVTFGADGNTCTKIFDLKGGGELSSSLVILDGDKPNKYWVSFYKGRLILGKGDVGKNVFCMYVDADAPNGIYKIGFSGKASIKNLEIWPEVELGFDQNVAEYVKRRQSSLIQGKINVIVPFDYLIEQEGPAVAFRDKFTGMKWNIAATPDPGLQYNFKLNINADGTPEFLPGLNIPTPEKIVLNILVKVFQAAKTTAFSSSQQMAYGTGPETISSIAALAACASVGATGAVAAAAEAGIKSKLDEMQKKADRYIFTERVDAAAKSSTTVSEEAKSDRKSLEDYLKKISDPLPDAIEKLDPPGQFDYKTKLWAEVLRLITSGYVIENSGDKQGIISGITSLYNSVKALGLSTDTLPVYKRMIDILIKAYNNPYLTVVGDLLDEQNRANWYNWIRDLSKEFFNSDMIMSKGFDADFKGEYFWIPVSFSTPGKGSVTFEVKAYSDIFVCLSESATQLRSVSNRMYEIIIGMWDNKKTVIHRKSLGDAVVEFDHAKIQELTPDPASFKKYWININNGVISGGVGELGQNKLWEWKDPYPSIPVKWVGLSNWLSINTFKNVKVGAPV